MFEEFVRNKISSESGILNNLNGISRDNIVKSNLSEFSKNYLLTELTSDPTTEQLSEIIIKSNKLYFNFTIRPKWTLLTFLFSSFESRPPNDILKKLSYFPFYKYYRDSITEFIKERDPIFVTKPEVTALINNTNDAIYNKLTSEISGQKIKNLFLQIFLLKYEDEALYNLESSVPFSFIKIFLEDKSFSDLDAKFSRLKNLTDEKEISLKDIIIVLTDKFSMIEKEDPVEVRNEISIQDKNEIVIKDTVPVIKAAEKIEITVDEKKETEKKEIEIIKTDNRKIYSEELIKADSENKPGKQKEIALEEIKVKEEISRKGIIKNLFNDKRTGKITDIIYNSDIIMKEKSFEKLSECRSWKEASNHLKNIFQNNEVDIYNKEVITFVNVLNEYFKKLE